MVLGHLFHHGQIDVQKAVSVSYTHLDVYKRQAIYRFLGQPGALNYGQALAMSVLLLLRCV